MCGRCSVVAEAFHGCVVWDLDYDGIGQVLKDRAVHCTDNIIEACTLQALPCDVSAISAGNDFTLLSTWEGFEDRVVYLQNPKAHPGDYTVQTPDLNLLYIRRIPKMHSWIASKVLLQLLCCKLRTFTIIL